jgi:predicted Zn-dependent peptidase
MTLFTIPNRTRPSSRALAAAAVLALVAAGPALALELDTFQKRVTEHTLENGWHFIIVERPGAPVFSFNTTVDVGSAQEVPGITGLAHMFEHMAFKGTPNIGTTDYDAEKMALQQVEEAYRAYDRLRLDPEADPELLEQARRLFEERQAEADKYVVRNEFGDIIDREGGSGLNATTSADETRYFYSLPANKVELFAYLESERFLHPVFREFYKERDVVQEERRMRTESTPFGRLFENVLTAAFTAHPYKQPTVGYMSDLQAFTMTDAEAFYRTWYAPSNMVTVLVGAIKADEVIPVLEKYFGRVDKGVEPPVLRTIEPEQTVERTVVLRDPAQPIYAETYHKPAATHPDEPAYEAMAQILGGGGGFFGGSRTSRLYRSLVEDKKVALFAASMMNLPGGKYPTLFSVMAAPTRGTSNEELQKAIRTELDRIKSEPVSDEELQRFKTRARASLIRSMGSNQGLANQMAAYYTLHGDWREMFHELDRLQKVSKEDIQRVANQTFKATNRTVAMIETEDAEKPADGSAS